MTDETQTDQAEVSAFDVEAYFPPVKGGMVDTARRQMAKDAAQAQAAADAAASVVPAYVPVTVKIRQPDDWGARTLTLAAGASQMAMPADTDRKRGLVNLITASAQVLIAKDRSAADSGTGYTLLSGQAPVAVEHGREVWLNNPGMVTIQVSIFSESYTRE